MLIFHLYTLFLLVSDLFSKVCRDQVCCRSDSKKIPISSSGSAAVTERNLLRTVLFFGPHYICFLGLVRGYIRALFCQKLHFFSSFQLFSLCASPCVGIMGRFPCFLLSVLSWRVCSLVFFFFLSCLLLSAFLSCQFSILKHDCAKHVARTRASWST